MHLATDSELQLYSLAAVKGMTADSSILQVAAWAGGMHLKKQTSC